MTSKFFSFLLILLLSFFAFSLSAKATSTVEDATALPAKTSTPAPATAPSAPDAGSVIDANQPLYFPTTPENLAKSYWLLGTLDIAKSKNIDEYLMVTECTLYKQFYKDDFEWEKIRSATKSYLNSNIQNFSRRFEYIQPISIGRYDEDRGGFQIAELDQMIGIKRMQVSYNNVRSYPCLDTSLYSTRDLPINAVLSLSRPFDYTFIKVAKGPADEYLKYLEDNHLQDSPRVAYIRFRFKVEQSMGTSVLGNDVYANFYGSLESVSVFGDRQYFIKFEDKQF